MINLRQAAQQALEAWFRPHGINYVDFKPYMEALRAALAEPEQEPLPDKVLRGFFILTNTAEPLAEGWPGLERFARAIERAHGIGEQT